MTKKQHKLKFYLTPLIIVMLLTALSSLALGNQNISLTTLINTLQNPQNGQIETSIIWQLRLPRTIIALLAGSALAASTTLIQGITRNPLADTGLLGINAGAALAIVTAINIFGITSQNMWVAFALAGATIVATFVYLINGKNTTSTKLILSGTAISATLTSLINIILLSNIETFATFRFWATGSLTGQNIHTATLITPIIIVGFLLASLTTKTLDILTLGETISRGLGQNVPLTKIFSATAIILLAGSATALAGPLLFVGLISSHLARKIAGNTYQKIMPLSICIGPIVLLTADIIGRLLIPNSEIEAGIVLAFLGTPIMIALIRNKKLAKL